MMTGMTGTNGMDSGSYPGSTVDSMGEPNGMPKGDMYDEFGGSMGNNIANMGNSNMGSMGQAGPESYAQNTNANTNIPTKTNNLDNTGNTNTNTDTNTTSPSSHTPSKSSKENVIVASVRSSIASWLYPDAKTVSEDNLGGENEAYFDKTTGKWVFPGEVS